MSFHDNLLSRRRRSTVTPAPAETQRRLEAEVGNALEREGGSNSITPVSSVPAAEDAARTKAAASDGPHASARPFSVKSLAERWGCSSGTVHGLIKSGALAHFRVGELIRVTAIEVERFECAR